MKNGYGNSYRGTGDVFSMSPVSAKAFSPRAMTSSPPSAQQQQQQVESIFAGSGRLEGSDWWKVSKHYRAA